MRLLERKAISNDFNAQRKAQIDEGVRIAQKVDALRETLLSLEAQHKNFIASTQQELKNATSQLEEQRSILSQEVSRLEAKRKELLKPLDEEWENLNENKAKHIKESEKLSDKFNELKLREENLIEREVRYNQKEVDIKERDELSVRLYSESERLKNEAGALHSRKLNEYSDFEKEKSLKLKEFSEIESNLINHSNVNKYKEQLLNKREKELNNKERRLSDQYKTLQKTLQRIKK